MAEARLDGLTTHYEVTGDGPPLLLFSPGGFNAVAHNWQTMGLYRRLQPVAQLSSSYTCITFDRRESGGSGGRLERVRWSDYARQGKALLDHLGFERAHLAGGCAGCSVAVNFAVSFPAATAGMVLISPAGGARYRINQHARFATHLAYAAEAGLGGVVERARSTDATFGQDPRVGPWASVIRADAAFADAYAATDPGEYAHLVTGMSRTLFDRDTVSGAEPEDLLRLHTPALVIPGHDPSHGTSAARYLEECLPAAQYWDVPVSAQTAANASSRMLAFLRDVDARTSAT